MARSSPPAKSLTNGEFRNGNWYCNCQPRRIARKKTVTRNTKNYGKGFYVCNIEPNEGNWCGFFLWVEEAEKRARAYFSTNGRSEKRQTTLDETITSRKGKAKKGKEKEKDKDKEKHKNKAEKISTTNPVNEKPTVEDGASSSKNHARAPMSKLASPAPERHTGDDNGANTHATTSDEEEEDDDDDDDDDDDEEEVIRPTKPQSTGAHSSAMPRITTRSSSSSKRKRSFEDEPDLLEDLSSSCEDELVAVTDNSSKHYDAFATPSARRTTDVKNGFPTPSLTATAGRSTKKVLFQVVDTEKPSAKRPRIETNASASGPTTLSGPTAEQLWGTSAVIYVPSSSPSAASASTPPTGPNPDDLTKEVLELLKNETIAPSVRGAVRKTLEKFVSQAKGYERGRDTARKAAKEADDRVARLQVKVDALEMSRQDLRTQLMDMWSKL
ncbi:hypothetical protein GGS21DRAFT_515119 [Xylaria nigripes]|nr:hypothetical protein GGS21DRAFT_515119 [Xylaria nigripes]